MKKTVKMLLKTGLALLLMAGMITGCASSTDMPVTEQNEVTEVVEVEETSEVTPEAETDVETEVGSETDDTTECPEGYVYDYQVSMEPIPVEIAELGGPCQGTIHAFPSKIGMALTELEMEKDPVLKEEVEKRIPEIEAALEEEIGGDFTVDGVIDIAEFTWVFLCKENDTDYQFDLSYTNFEYSDLPFDNIVYTDDYYDEVESVTLRNELLPIIEELYAKGTILVRAQSGVDVVDVVIAQYTEEGVDKGEEQSKLIKLWEKLQDYNTNLFYNINLCFFTPSYEDVLREKMSTTIRDDFSSLYSEEVIRTLIENHDMWCGFIYSDIENEENANSMDSILKEYASGNYNEEAEWDYWIY